MFSILMLLDKLLSHGPQTSPIGFAKFVDSVSVGIDGDRECAAVVSGWRTNQRAAQSHAGQTANQRQAYRHMHVSAPITQQHVVTYRSGTVSLAIGWKYFPVILLALRLGPTAAYN